MTREEVYNECLKALGKSNSILLELPTGYGKSKLSLDIVNYLAASPYYKNRKVTMLLLVAKRVHKQTWRDEMEKWGGVNADVTIECYESLKKYQGKKFDILLMDEVHHVGSDLRLELFSTVGYGYMLGLSATIPRNLKQYFRYKYHSKVVSCDIIEAIEDEILPEPEIVLMPLTLDNTAATETLVLNPKVSGPAVEIDYKDIRKYKFQKKVKVLVKCTPKQKLMEINSQILSEKNAYMRKRSKALETIWLYHCGKRLEYLSSLKNNLVLSILKKLDRYRTITFCKTIEQCEILGKNCIHSKNLKSDDVYEKFNQKKLRHITAVNILNENANLVDCKYAIFANMPASEVVQVQRIGRSLRHKSPVIIMPYYTGTREEELIEKVTEGFDKKYIRTIHSVEEI